MFLGIDAGTSGVKAVIAAEDGSVLAQSQAPLVAMRPNPLWSEQDPHSWWGACRQAVLGLDPGLRRKLRGVGIAGQMHGATLLDANDQILRPAILWNDGRSFAECTALEARVPELRTITGNIAMPGFTAPKLLWVAQHEPEIFARIATVLLPKDYLRLCMTGEKCADMSDAAGTLWLDMAARDWSDPILAACGLSRAQMPRLVEGSAEAGHLLPAVAAAWGMEQVPVAGGGGDNAAGAAGVGVVKPGDALLSLGTSGVIFVVSDQFRANSGRTVHSFCHCLPGLWHQMSVHLSAASCVDWAARQLGLASPAALFDLAATVPPGYAPELFLPYLSGERTPYNNPHLRAGFLGLDNDTTPARLAAAVLEGVAFALADGLDALREAGARIDRLAVIGGGARSAHWGGILAAALDAELVYLHGGEVGPALGAARLAQCMVEGGDPAGICVAPEIARVVSPDPEIIARLRAKSAGFRAAALAVNQLSQPKDTQGHPSMTEYFASVPQIRFEGTDSPSDFAYRYYDKNRLVLGKTMAEHLRFAVCFWHGFCWPGGDMFGSPTMERPWLMNPDHVAGAAAKREAAFDFITRLDVPYYCFHDVDVMAEAHDVASHRHHFGQAVDHLGALQAHTGVKLLWGTANLFSHPRYAAGAATNPDPEVFAWAAMQVRDALEATHRLGGANYVLWGGREGYDTLINTRIGTELDHMGRFLSMVVEHKHKIGFKGTILIEPKPCEPTKHQYDFDVATVYGFLARYGLQDEVKLNIEANHATLAGHSFEHEIALAGALGALGSIDANRGDPQNGWDTDQFPNSVDDMTLAMLEILRAGGFTTGGFNFDAKVRRQSLDAADLFHAHIGGIDVVAHALLRAAAIIEDGRLDAARDARYAGWNGPLGQKLLAPGTTLAAAADTAITGNLAPQPVSGRQEWLENLLNRFA